MLAGSWHDPYTGTTLTFDNLKNLDQAQAIQIDHVVALKLAWDQGADKWNDATRLRFANDPDNLVATDGQANQDKGPKDASRWAPPLESSHCWFTTTAVTVKSRYGLGVYAAEREALSKMLDTCAN